MKNLFWWALGAEIVVGGVIGWKIANATTHPWAVKTRIPPPRRRPGQQLNPNTSIATPWGTITLEADEDLRDDAGRPCGIGWTDHDGNFHCDFYADEPRGQRQRADASHVTRRNAVAGGFVVPAITTRRRGPR